MAFVRGLAARWSSGALALFALLTYHDAPFQKSLSFAGGGGRRLPSGFGTSGQPLHDDRHSKTIGLQAALVQLYDFSGSAEEQQASLDRFERIDDVIMGGVSKSQLAPSDDCVSWRGIVRTEGGGFCGQRTRPFERPLNLSGADGVYIKCRLVSDTDVERRTWKMTMRTTQGRGEVVYQAPFSPPAGREMQTALVPFSKFVLVRGPVMVPGAPPISEATEVHQIGFTVSKFVLGEQTTQLENFRNGTFQLDIAEIGAYSDEVAQEHPIDVPRALSEEDVSRKRSALEKVLRPVFRAIFSEDKRRRRRAAQILQERGASRLGLLRFGWQFRRNLRGQSVGASTVQTLLAVVSWLAGTALLLFAKALIFPIVGRQMRKRRREEMERLKVEMPNSEKDATAR